MRIKLILSLILLLLVTLFAVQNADVITIKFLLWELDISLALMIFLTFTIGLVFGLSVPSFVRKPVLPEHNPRNGS